MRLKEETRIMLDALASMGNYVEVVDKNGTYVYCSENITYETGSASDLVGKHITQAFNLTDDTSVLMQTLKTGKPQRDVFLHYNVRTSGREFYWLYNSFPLIIDGKIEGAIATYRELDSIKNVVQCWNSVPSSSKSARGNISGSGKGMYVFDDIVTSCPKMMQSIELAKRISAKESSVLIVGETGTGKELFAQSIHSYGAKNNRPFVAINCAAIPNNLIESILFGVAKGAYTGAVEKRGLLEESSGGTIYLDELNSLDPILQVKLLRAIESKKIRRVGGDREININPRVISSLNVAPKELIACGQLKSDLYYRLAVITINIPPLRERKGDIPILSANLIMQINQKLDADVAGCSDEVLSIFSKYSWPGNVRELRHALEYAITVMGDHEKLILREHLPEYFEDVCHEEKQPGAAAPTAFKKYPIGDYKLTRQEAIDDFSDYFNREFLTQALDENKWNVSKTAKAINISRQHLHELINKYNLNSI